MSETPVNVVNEEDPPQKTAKQLEKEKQKLAKLEKFKLKQEKKKSSLTTDSKRKAEKLERKKDPRDVITYTIDTPAGEKKDTNCPMPDAYSPLFVEAAWYSWWEKQGFFKPEYGGRDISQENPKGKFVMVIPPPNVTGFLHLGHALTNAVEDTITRWNRMKGRTTLWNPGCDHAGIATQVVVEKKLWKEEKKTRYDVGREKFIEKVWEWKNEKSDRIYDQLKKLGGSFDWDRACFTMDKKCCKAVTEAFVRLHEDGAIYRSNRLVNWSCTLKSAISDIEVDKRELTGRTMLTIPGYEKPVEFGAMIYFIYLVENTDDKIVVATTRPETMLGDTAIAVNPKDRRYNDMIGKKVVHPFCDRLIEIIGDDYVDMEFGTGAVKITPAHDPNDYEIGKRHNLSFITIFSEDGKIIGDYGKFTGMKRFDARTEIIMELIERKLLVEVKDNPMVVPICSRSKDIVEPMIKPQWYVKCDDMAAKAKESVISGELKILPEQFKKTWFTWMDGIRDWCISRQLWWGHRIPAYFVKLHDFEPTDDEKNNYWVSGRTEEEARKKAAEKFNIGEDKFSLEQDSDVLDTWFSSGIFPFSIFGWPDKTKELEAFYPGTLLETGHDILFFWVARMVFLGQKLMGKLPFREVYLHAMVRDAHGRKMSKSLGNVIDPMDVIKGISLHELQNKLLDSNLEEKELARAMEGQQLDYPHGIPECGTDALRFALCAYTRQGRDINLDILRVQGYRTFCNKIWNATRFALNYLGEEFHLDDNDLTFTGDESRMDLWMLSRLTYAVKTCDEGMSQYDFTSVTTACYNLWLYELCDFYLEYLKPIMLSGTDLQKETSKKVLFRALDMGLRLLSPLMPFITEELYQRLPRKEMKYPSICVAPYPETEECPWRNEAIEQDFELAQKVIKHIRSVRAAYTILKRTKTEVFFVSQDKSLLRSINDFSDVIETLTSSVVMPSDNIPSGCVIITVTDKLQLHILLKGLIDPKKEVHKLETKREYLKEVIQKVNQAMSAADYKKKVPKEVQTTNKERISNSEAEILQINEALATIQLM